MTTEHKILDILQHVWPYISGFFLIMFATIKLWWHDRRELSRRVSNVEMLAESSAKELVEIKEEFKRNHDEHNDIMRTILRLHSK